MLALVLKPSAAVQLWLDRPWYLPGDTVKAFVRATIQRDIVVTGAPVSLVWRHKWAWSGDESGGTEVTEVPVGRMAFCEPGPLAAGAVVEREVTFPLPAELPPSLPGKWTTVTYDLRAELEAERAFDPAAAAVVVVLSPAERCDEWAATGPEGSTQRIGFRVGSRTVIAGTTVQGTLDVWPEEPAAAKEIKVRLRRTEEVLASDGIDVDDTVAEATLATDVPLVPGAPLALPFALTVPADACPSGWTHESRVRWHLLAHVVRGMFRADHLSLQLNVFNAPQPSDAARP